jgi:hypothetical protein
MRFELVSALGALAAAMPLAAQDNPYAFTGGSVKSAYIVYDVTSKQPAPGASYEVGVAPDRMIMKMVTPYEIAGKKDTMRMFAVTTRDSQYTYTVMGGQREGKVSPTLRSHLQQAYAKLDAAGKARFKQNLTLMRQSSDFGGDSDFDVLVAYTGKKSGSETIAGQKCDVYTSDNISACVVPGAPMVFLRWSDQKQGLTLTAKKVSLNGPLPPTAGLLPKNVQWVKEPADDADYANGIWEFKKQSDSEQVPPATLAKFAVGYLASPAAAAELREMGVGSGESEESGTAEADSDAAESEN